MTDALLERVDRQQVATIVATASIALVIGAWIGLMAVPDAALSVPMVDQPGPTAGPRAAFIPVPQWLPILSLAVPILGVGYAWSLVARDDQDDPEAVDDPEDLDQLKREIADD